MLKIKLFTKTLIQAIIRHNIGYQASIMSYFAFTSMIPLTLLLIYTSSLVVRGTQIETFMDQLLQSYIPTIPHGQKFIQETVRRLTDVRGVVSIVGFIGLLWGSIGGFMSLQQILDTLCEIKHRRSFFKQYVIGFTMLGILLALIAISSIIMEISPGFLHELGIENSVHWAHLGVVIGKIAFAVILLVTCFFCYRVLPSKPLGMLPLVTGAIVSTGLIYISRLLFMIYTHHLGNYAVVYGALTYMMLLTFWFYIVSIIFLLGMEVALTLKHIREKSEEIHKRFT